MIESSRPNCDFSGLRPVIWTVKTATSLSSSSFVRDFFILNGVSAVFSSSFVCLQNLFAPFLWEELIFMKDVVFIDTVISRGVLRMIVRDSQLITHYRRGNCVCANALSRWYVVYRLDDQICARWRIQCTKPGSSSRHKCHGQHLRFLLWVYRPIVVAFLRNLSWFHVMFFKF